MSYSEIKKGHLWTALLAAIGTGAYAFPLIIPWHVLLLFASVFTGFVFHRSGLKRIAWATLCFIVVIAVLKGYLPSPLATAVVSASALSVSGAPILGIAVLLMHFSVTMTAQEIVGSALHLANLEAAGPALVASGVLLLVRLRYFGYALAAAALAVLAAWISAYVVLRPEVAMAISAIPACGLAALVTRQEYPTSRIGVAVLLSAILTVFMGSWIWTGPRTWDQAYVLVPDAPNAFEASFFENYVEALRFAGIEAEQTHRPEEIPSNALLILPWTTQPFIAEGDEALSERIGQLARERKWTVVVVGEHTDLGGSSERIDVMVSQPFLRRDITVPPGNLDSSGPLHSTDFRAWPHASILNRGASVGVNSILDKVLLAGDGWWAEPDIGEWLWAGDYVWSPDDRSGRLALAVASDIGGARWIVVGDNSPFINSQIFADPRPVIRIMEMASLWPALLSDVLLLLFVSGVSLGFISKSWSSYSTQSLIFLTCSFTIVSSALVNARTDWPYVYVGETGFDERNFNLSLADNPRLLQDRRFIRLKFPVTGKIPLYNGETVTFMLVEGSAEIGDVTIHSCRRMGSLATSEGPYLMDAQACQVDGPANVLIGTPDAAAAFSYSHENGRAFVFFDTAFLARKAPETNADWLVRQMDQ